MTKVLSILLSISVFSGTLFVQPFVEAANVEVTWTAPEKYRDIYSGNEGRKSFRKKVFRKLEQHISKLAEALPESQLLEIEITDVDLAGDVHMGGINQIRVIKGIYFPRINLKFKLTDANKSIIHTGKEKLKDMNFMMSVSLRYRNKTFGYEKQLLDDWFENEFANYVMK
jgi:hypothetical protein